jgi:membrane protein DedA with SNARE-associated domain
LAASWVGIPIVGGAVLTTAGVLAGDGQLDLRLVILVGAWTGGHEGGDC